MMPKLQIFISTSKLLCAHTIEDVGKCSQYYAIVCYRNTLFTSPFYAAEHMATIEHTSTTMNNQVVGRKVLRVVCATNYIDV